VATERHAAKGKARASNPEISAPASRARKPRPNGSTAGYAQSTKMTPLLEQFAIEYLVDFNAAAAWRRANGKLGRPIPKNCAAAGYNALKHPMVQQRAAKAREIALAKAGITVEKTETEIARMAYIDIGDLYRADGTFKAFHEMSEDARHAIVAVETEELFDFSDEEDVRKRLYDVEGAVRALLEVANAMKPGELGALAVPVAALRGWAKPPKSDEKSPKYLVGYLRKVKLADKRGAVEMAARRDGIFKDKLVHEAGSSLEAIIAASHAVPA
jgi:hypothetical protein